MKTILFLISMVIIPAAHADFQGSVAFTEAERVHHRDSIQVITSTASQCLADHLERHLSFYRKWKISPFYGSNSDFKRMSDAQRRAYLRRLRLPESLVDQMESTSCIGLALKCLGQGFAAAGEAKQWTRVKDFTVKNGGDGLALQHALQQLGWKVLYWNPSVAKNESWDDQEEAAYPDNPHHIWGRHAYHWSRVRSDRRYLYNRVDDISQLVNFGKKIPSLAAAVPFFVGTAHGGYHVFPGYRGQVIEGHSTRPITDKQTIETSPFSPLQDGGGPRGGPYKSGLMAIPPGYLTR